MDVKVKKRYFSHATNKPKSEKLKTIVYLIS